MAYKTFFNIDFMRNKNLLLSFKPKPQSEVDLKHIVYALLLLSCSYAYAHPGHDHSHWMSDAQHLLLTMAIAAIIALCLKIKRKDLKKLEEK